jgi:hypothetical protein
VTNSDATQGTKSGAYTYDSTGTATFSTVNSTILQPKCASCHGGSGGFFVDTYANVLTRVSTSDYSPTNSLIFQRISTDSMPSGGPPLSSGEKTTIRSWILGGAQNN